MPGIFGTLNIGTSGLFAQQAAINVTSHNIANANTDGYTRQSAVLEASVPYAMPSTDNAAGPGQMGTGVTVKTIERIRDSYTDYQIRTQNGIQGQYTASDTYLSQVESIFNEPSDTGISSAVDQFFNDWQSLASAPESSSSRTQVVQDTQALTDQLNETASQLSDLKSNCQTVIQNTVFNINDMLNQLNNVNEQIMQVSVNGNTPNDLMDTRDSLLDKLSSEFGITISNKDLNGMDVTTSNEPQDSSNPTGGSAPIDPTTGSPMNIVQLQNSSNSARFSYINSITDANGNAGYSGAGVYTVSYYKNGDMTNEANKVTIKVNLTSEDQYNQLDESRTLWADNSGNALKVNTTTTNGTTTTTAVGTLANNSTCNFNELDLFQPPTGELKGYTSVQQDIDSYSDQLNQLAKAIALSVNAVHSQSNTWTADTSTTVNNFFVNKDDPSTETGEDNITAANISINSAILNNAMLIQTGTSSTSGESDGNRALAISQIKDSLMDIQDMDPNSSTRQSFVSSMSTDASLGGVLTINSNPNGMTIDNYFSDTVDKLGTQEQQAQRMIQNQTALLSSLQDTKESTSGVSLDEEMANLVQYQHAYQANAKVISTVDQMLDVIINGLMSSSS